MWWDIRVEKNSWMVYKTRNTAEIYHINRTGRHSSLVGIDVPFVVMAETSCT